MKYADIIINRKSPAVDRVFTYAVPQPLQAKACPGMLVKVPFNRENLEGVIIRLHDQAPAGMALREVAGLLSEKPLFSQELLQLSAWLAEYYACSRAAALQAMLPAGLTLSGRPPRSYSRDYYRLAPAGQAGRLSPKRRELADYLSQQGEADTAGLEAQGYSRDFLRACVKAGLLLRERRRAPLGEEDNSVQPTGLNGEQTQAYQAIRREWQGQDRPFLLHGVTGSGKTEIYLRLIRDVAETGRHSLVLVPEIALSTQMLDMLTRRLDLPVAVLHSGLKQAERRQIWQDIAEGRYPVVVGARSAVFAPTPALGLLIIDEEHENSYKQDNTPRFSAVTTGLERARLARAHLVLGSATPAVESYYQALQGVYAYGELKAHYYAAPPALVDVVDMRQELRAGNKLIFSRLLLDAIQETLDNGGQTILFLNRRGYYQHFSCRSCGGVVTCPHCAVAMSFHEDGAGGCLKCHYCGRMLKPPTVCPVCGSGQIRHFGVGTQRVADEIARLLPEARVARLDSDVVAQQGGHERIYRAMGEGKIDILVGTQMVAKGLDFPHVELAAVIAADTMLNLPSFRAGERAFQLITQLIGRAGRRSVQGRAVIQTYAPEALPILAAAAGDYQGFFQAELEERRLHNYPPFKHLLRLLLSSQDRALLWQAGQALAEQLRALLASEDELCGPADAPLARIKDLWRRQLMVKTGDVPRLTSSVEAAWAQALALDPRLKRARLAVDVDPVSMM